jgi:hypothetical protein
LTQGFRQLVRRRWWRADAPCVRGPDGSGRQRWTPVVAVDLGVAGVSVRAEANAAGGKGTIGSKRRASSHPRAVARLGSRGAADPSTALQDATCPVPCPAGGAPSRSDAAASVGDAASPTRRSCTSCIDRDIVPAFPARTRMRRYLLDRLLVTTVQNNGICLTAGSPCQAPVRQHRCRSAAENPLRDGETGYGDGGDDVAAVVRLGRRRKAAGWKLPRKPGAVPSPFSSVPAQELCELMSACNRTTSDRDHAHAPRPTATARVRDRRRSAPTRRPRQVHFASEASPTGEEAAGGIRGPHPAAGSARSTEPPSTGAPG